MRDFILGAIAIMDAFVGLVASHEFVRVFFGAAVIVGFVLVGVAIIVGALTAARIGLAAVLRLVMKGARR